ncbi:hypothetical protein HUO13_26865 [Saccharopolyspora erythraea]|uniref:hypothetical protein n=1 Tax=Saccharopolyspora erythraea TaxID=1836 RepID=UPI001BA44CB3|nr:hypothetical protein [Saccharopolyspora erythraea]QUH03956.1 hypothetical protein HUO13_26865 [Saccharopolyspora erythraea]
MSRERDAVAEVEFERATGLQPLREQRCHAGLDRLRANDASSGPPASAASAVYSAILVRSTCGTKYSESALSSTTTRTSSPDSSSPDKATRSRTNSGPDQVHRRRIDHNTQHTVVTAFDAQRAVSPGHLLHPRMREPSSDRPRK